VARWATPKAGTGVLLAETRGLTQRAKTRAAGLRRQSATGMILPFGAGDPRPKGYRRRLAIDKPASFSSGR
jgi:hypothetical protein